MKTYDYKFIDGLDLDFIYLLNSDITEYFGEDFLSQRVHAYTEQDFYFIGDLDEQQKMNQIIKNMIQFGLNNNMISNPNIYSVNDVTQNDSILNNNVKNIYSDKNVLIDSYYKFNDTNSVLDKILEFGINSLNKHDHKILESIK